MKAICLFGKLVAPAFVLSLMLLPISVQAEMTDPFATPPKNLKAEDVNGYSIQSYTPQGPPAPPAPPVDVDTTDVEGEMNYTGKLMPGEETDSGKNSYELLLDSGETINLSVAKDLASYLGKRVTITALVQDGSFEIQKMYVHKEEKSEVTAPAPETVEKSETEALKAASTGSGLWIAIVMLALFLSGAGYGFLRKEKVISWTENVRNQWKK